MAEPAALLRRFTSGLLLRCLLFVAIFSLAAIPPIDTDLWWHLANGRLMVMTASIPHVDVYSFSAAGQPWVMHEWLADLGMYAIFQLGGLPLLVALFAGLVTAAAGCLYWLLRRAGLHPTGGAALTLVGALAGSTAWGARPQVLNPLMTGLLLIGLLRYREGRLSAWLLPPFVWLWANLHSAFLVGLIIAGLFAAGEAFDAWRRRPGAMSWPRIRRLAAAIVAATMLSLVNPFGIQTLLFPLGTLTSALIQNNIQEWGSPDFHTLSGLLLEALVFLLLAGLATRRVTLRAGEVLLAVALLYLAFSSQRHVPLFVLGAALICGRCGQALLELGFPALAKRRPAGAPRPGLRLGLLNLALLVVLAVGMVGYRALPNLRSQTEASSISQVLPVQATDALVRLGRPVRVFNYYDYGGYLIWRLVPGGSRVFIDGRVEVYGSRIFGDYLRVNYLGDDWRVVLQRAQPDAIMLPNGHPLVRLLQQDAEWQQFTRDRVATVFTRVGFAP
jgi:hypothetical protein